MGGLPACHFSVTAGLSVLRARRYGELLLAMHNTLQATSEWAVGRSVWQPLCIDWLGGWVYTLLSRHAIQQQRSRQRTRR